MKEEINNQICELSGDVFHYLVIHHIDGNKENNSKKNLLCIGEHYHSKIHFGLGNKDCNIPEETQERILFYRKIWLEEKITYLTKRRIRDLLDVERIKSNKITRYFKNQCRFCKRKSKLIYLLSNKYIRYYKRRLIDKKFLKKSSFVVCKKCYEDKDNLYFINDFSTLKEF